MKKEKLIDSITKGVVFAAGSSVFVWVIGAGAWLAYLPQIAESKFWVKAIPSPSLRIVAGGVSGAFALVAFQLAMVKTASVMGNPPRDKIAKLVDMFTKASSPRVKDGASSIKSRRPRTKSPRPRM